METVMYILLLLTVGCAQGRCHEAKLQLQYRMLLFPVPQSDFSMSTGPYSPTPDGICWGQGCHGEIQLLASTCPDGRYILNSGEVVGSKWEGKKEKKFKEFTGVFMGAVYV